MLENLERVLQVEFLIDVSTRVNLHPLVSKLFLLIIEEGRSGSIAREEPEGEKGEQYCATSFNQEEISPIGQRTRCDLEYTICEEATKSRGNALRCIEDG